MIRAALLALVVAAPAAADGRDCVILLHGLARTDASLLVLEEALRLEGFRVVNSDYDSAAAPIQDLAEAALPRAIDACGDAPAIHVVTHSMGAILLRVWMSRAEMPRLYRTVMLAPPNQGSELADALSVLPPYEWINGPAGGQLGTGDLPARLGPVWPGVGVIAGTRSLNAFYSTLLPGPDDGKVSVAATRVEGMDDHIALPVTHTFMMNAPVVIAQVLAFLRHGRFDPSRGAVELLDDLAEELTE
jgi:hypothetical protein